MKIPVGVRNNGKRAEMFPDRMHKRRRDLSSTIHLSRKSVQRPRGVIVVNQARKGIRDQHRRLLHKEGIPVYATDPCSIRIQLPGRIQNAQETGRRIRRKERPEPSGALITMRRGNGPGDQNSFPLMNVRGVINCGDIVHFDGFLENAPPRLAVAVRDDKIGTVGSSCKAPRLTAVHLKCEIEVGRQEKQTLPGEIPTR